MPGECSGVGGPERKLRPVSRKGPVEGRARGPVDIAATGPAASNAAGAAGRRRVVDLGIAVDRASGVPLPDQVEHLVHTLIARGELGPGEPLPSSRALAAELTVSRGVVVEAYDRLLRHGLLVSRPGGAVRVSTELAPPDAPAALTPDGRPVADAARDERPAAVPIQLDLHPANTPIGTLDRRAWAAAQRASLRDATEAELGSLDRAGVLGLREAVVAQLARSRGVVASAEQVAITTGVTDALHGLAPLLRARGGRVAVEDPGFGLHRATLIGAGLDVVPVPADAEGLDVAALAAADVCAVLVTPAHQMPLGVPLAPERRAALVAWARETGAWIIEDDYDGELRYDRRGVRSLHGLAPDRVLYVGTTSKVLSPAVRIGWLIMPPELTEEILAWRMAFGGAPSNLIQLAVAEYLRSGAFDRGVSRMRRRCAAQRAALVEALAVSLPGHAATGVEAGLNITVRVPDLEPWKLVMAGQARGAQVFATDDGDDALLLVGFGLVEPGAAARAAEEIRAVVDAARALP